MIIKIVNTEKSQSVKEMHRLVFTVSLKTSKDEVKDFFAKQQIKCSKINTLVRRGKIARVGNSRGRSSNQKFVSTSFDSDTEFQKAIELTSK